MKIRVAFAALSLLFLAAYIWFSVRIGRQNERIALLEKDLKAAQSMPTPPHAAPPPAEAPAVATPAPRQNRNSSPVSPASTACADTQALNAKLDEANASQARIQSHTSELETQVEELTRERARLATAGTEAQSRLTELNQTIQSLTEERSQFDKRIKDVESENGRLRLQTQVSAQKNVQFLKDVAEFQELSRRQQTYTTTILRRYRELTDLFRSLPGMVEGKGDGPELARIQYAVSMADEDLRQLNDLNARLGRVRNQIAAAPRP
jgi:chromosome segregation ATPase